MTAACFKCGDRTVHGESRSRAGLQRALQLSASTAALMVSTKCPAAEPQASGPAESPPAASSDRSLLDFIHIWGNLGMGRALRFNNPYRLERPIGATAESLSWTQWSQDTLLGATVGDPFGWQHGLALGLAFTTHGVPQQVATLSYVLRLHLSNAWATTIRVGAPTVLSPQLNVGGELGVGVTFMALAGIGVFAELNGGVFEGAGTDQRAATLIPLLGATGGLSFHYEVLP